MTRKFIQPFIVILSAILFSIGCNFLTGTSQPQSTATIRIVNDHVRGSDPFPGGKNLPDTREYGICIITYPPVIGITKPTFDMILARDGQKTNYGLPAGTYALQEWQFDSEINQDPLYSPAMKTLVRPTEIVVLKADQITQFGSDRSLPAPGDFVEGALVNSHCGGAFQQTGGQPTITPERSTDTPEPETNSSGEATVPPSEATKPAEAAAAGAWVLKLVQPDVGKTEIQFSYPGLACNGGTKAISTETTATITSKGTCQVNGALVANSVSRYSWSRPPDRLTPGEMLTGSLTASSSGLCNWTGPTTEDSSRNSATTSHTAWRGDGWPGGPKEFPYQDLIYGNDYDGTARALTKPTGSFKWKVPDGSLSGGKTLVLQFCAATGTGKVYTNFWYEWQNP